MATKLKPEVRKRWLVVKDKPLLHGAHSPNGKMCAMEMAAFIAGEPWSDHPACVSPVIGGFVRSWNDALNDEDRQMLKPYIPKILDTAADQKTDRRRSWMALDWSCRVSAPAWLRLAKLDKYAAALEAMAPIVDATSAKAAQKTLDEAKAAASAAWAAAGYAAWDAAGYAAWDAAGDAAWAAAGDAAWAAAGDAAGAAAWDAAGAAAGAAARAAARAAAWDAAGAAAGAPLRPTVEVLQKSALDLLERMIAA